MQEWVQATDLRITLDRMNTFGDEVFGDDQVLQSYYYAIADVAVGARCACNGHAGECVNSTSLDGRTRRICRSDTRCLYFEKHGYDKLHALNDFSNIQREKKFPRIFMCIL